MFVLGPCGSLKEHSCEGGCFSCCRLNPHRCFQSEVLRLSFPVLEPWVLWPVSLPSCSSWFIHMQMWDRPLWQLPPCLVLQLHPCGESSPPGCLSLPLLPVWMNVSSLTRWLLDFYPVRFSVSSGYFLFLKFVVVPLLVVQGGKVHLPTPPSWWEIVDFHQQFLFYLPPEFIRLRILKEWYHQFSEPEVNLSKKNIFNSL